MGRSILGRRLIQTGLAPRAVFSTGTRIVWLLILPPLFVRFVGLVVMFRVTLVSDPPLLIVGVATMTWAMLNAKIAITTAEMPNLEKTMFLEDK